MRTQRHCQAVIFDLDDTLLITAVIKWKHHKEVAKRFYGVDLTDEVLREHWGKPFDQMIQHLYRNADTVENMQLANRSIEDQFPKQIHDDTLDTITRLAAADLRLGIITAVNTAYAQQDLQVAGIPAGHFLFVQGADDTPYHKPDPRVFEPALAELARLGISKQGTVYVGDALADFYAARDAGLRFIGVATGFVTTAEFAAEGATAVARLRDIPALITSKA